MKLFFLMSILVSTAWVVHGQKIEYTLSTPSDTTRNYYITVRPEGRIRGAIILLPGFGELPASVLRESDIYKFASDEGLLTIIPALGDWSFFYIDAVSHQKLEEFIEEVFKKYQLNERTFFIGGHSFGGTMAIQYTQHAHSKGTGLRKPAAVFAVDPPLDLERLYNCMTTVNRPAKNPVSIQEDAYVSGRIEKAFNTNPAKDPKFFWTISPYSQSDPEHRSLTPLTKIPLRTYHEPDIDWYLVNRNIDYYCMNVIDGAAMVNWLRSLGNTRAELVTTSKRGYRIARRVRHPHSWSIVDGKELVQWMVSIAQHTED